MQTWIPSTDLNECARVLDNTRLGAQRGEGRAALLCLLRQRVGRTCGWANHPVTRMWKGYEQALVAYLACVCWEWSVARGFRDGTLSKILDDCAWAGVEIHGRPAMPEWWGGEIHRSHRRRLLWAKPEHYSRFWPEEEVPEDWERYRWPVTAG